MNHETQTIGKLFFSFEGRINRAKYWLFNILALNVAFLIIVGIFTLIAGKQGMTTGYFIGSIALLWPTIALNIKRCHDRNRPGWFLLVALVPVVNIWYMVEVLFLKGTTGQNQYGPDPLGQHMPLSPETTPVAEETPMEQVPH